MKKSNYVSIAMIALLQFVLSATASAHFIYVYSHDGKAKVVFGEGLEPDQARFLAGLKSMKAYKVEDGKRVPIELSQQTEAPTEYSARAKKRCCWTTVPSTLT
jgi:uncharacterized GH25 family protein